MAWVPWPSRVGISCQFFQRGQNVVEGNGVLGMLGLLAGTASGRKQKKRPLGSFFVGCGLITIRQNLHSKKELLLRFVQPPDICL